MHDTPPDDHAGGQRCPIRLAKRTDTLSHRFEATEHPDRTSRTDYGALWLERSRAVDRLTQLPRRVRSRRWTVL